MTLSATSLTIPEGATSRQKLADITFTDDGLGTNTASVSNDTLFEVIGNELYLKGGVNLDYETATEHQVTLTATTNPALTRTFTLTVSNEDDPPTAMTLSSESLTIPEGATSRQKLADITFTDDGLGTNTASVSNDTLFEVIGNELYLKGGVNLDYETATEHQVTLTATTNPALTRTFTLTVSNEDDPPTAMTLSATSLTIPEGATSRQKLADITFTDDGLGTNTASVSNDTLFEVIGNELYLKGEVELDYETATEHRVTLTATTNPALTRTFTLTVSNETEPSPPPSSGTGLSMWVIRDSIVEGPTYPQALAVLSFTSEDSGKYSFALSGDEHNMFEIVGNKLRLKAGIALDYENEAHRSHSITLKAVDSGGKTLASQPFTLSVTDRKDEEMSYIRITSGSEGQVVTENEEPGGPIYTLTAEASGYWEATAIFENPRFFDTNIISPGTIISFASNHSPDYEYKSSYSFTVIAWLTYSPEVIATQHVTIQVQDAPDPVTITSGDRGSRVLVDNKPFGRSAVYNATVAIESTEDNDYVRWYLRGADADIFKISRTTGKVTPRDREALVNYENRTSYSFTVEAHLNSDPDVNVLRDVTIEVRDASEAGFFVSFTSDDSNIVIRENEAVGDRVIHTFTTASNIGAVAPIISRGDSHLFNLSSSGELRFKDATFIPDYEAKASYTFLVGMRHPKDNTIKEHKWVTISVENDPSDDVAPETIETDAVELSIYENHPIHKNVLHDLDSSPDLGGFALTEGYKDNHLFKITDDGRIWFKAAPDYENPQDQGTNNLYQIKVSDGDATHHFAITVEDIRPEGRLEDSGDRDAPYGGILIYGGALKRIVHRSEINPYELPPIEIQEMMYGEMWLKSDMSGPTTITWSLELDDFTKDERFIDSDKKLPSLDRQPVINKVRQGIERALEEFEAAANLEFIEVMGDNTLIGDIIFTIPSVGRTANGGAAAVRAGTDIPATVWVPVTRSFDLAPRYQVLVHEIGHALGLHHPFDGNHGWQENDLRYKDPYTTMSYGQHSDVQGLFPLDIDALQYLYGAPGDDDDGVHALYLDLV